MSFKWEDNGYQPKGSDVEATPPKGGSAMQEEIVKPMNPYTAEDFANAIKDAMKEAVIEVEHNYSEFPKDESKVIPKPIWDMPTEYSGVMRLKADAYEDVNNILNALLYNGYEVTMRLEDATETEREVDGADRFVVIEYEER